MLITKLTICEKEKRASVLVFSFLGSLNPCLLPGVRTSLVLGLQGSASWRLLPDLVFRAWEPCSIWAQHTPRMHRDTLDSGYILHYQHRIHSLHKFPSQSLHMNPSLVFTSAQVLCFCQAKSGRNHRLVNSLSPTSFWWEFALAGPHQTF